MVRAYFGFVCSMAVIACLAVAPATAQDEQVAKVAKIGRVFFVGNTLVTSEKLAGVIGSKPGNVADDSVLREDVRRIEDAVAAAGGIAHVSALLNDGSGTYVFVIYEARIEAIEFAGLERTRPEAIQGELTLKAGEVLSERQLVRTLGKLQNLGLFAKVTSDLRPGREDPQAGVILTITFVEKPAD